MDLLRIQVILLLALVLTLILTSGNTASAVSEGLLSVKGTWIVNPVGRVVLLRGINYLGYEDGNIPEAHSESAYELFARVGFNVVRLPISWSNLEPFPGMFHKSYLEDYVDRDVRWAKKYGVYIILDMHQLNWGARFGGGGIPDWAVNQYPPTDEGMRHAVSDFWSQAEIQDHLVNVWTNIASRYANETTIAGYDILNEPWIYTSIIPALNASYVNDFYARVIRSIRTVDQNHIIFLEPANMYPLNFPFKENIVWSPHFYALSFETLYHQSNGGLLEADMAAKYQKFVVEMGSPMWIGEFGAFMKYGSDVEWLQDALRAFSKYQVGWAWWALDKRDGRIPSTLYITWANQRTTEEAATTEIETRNLEAYLALAVALEVAFIGILALSVWLRRRQGSGLSRRRYR
jgi:endoglycosylceramidase